MPGKSAFDVGEMMKMIEPEQITRFFDPERVQQSMAAFPVPGLDLQAVLASNKKNFYAMLTANKAAADAYKGFYQQQISIFNDLMEGAKAHFASLGKLPDTEALKKQAEIYHAAAEKAFGNMAALAETARNANQDAFAVIESRVQESIAELKQI